MHCCFSPAFFAIPRFQPFCRAFLDNDLFWSKRNLPLQEAVIRKFRCENSSLGKLLYGPREVGVRPNVCHFETSRWATS